MLSRMTMQLVTNAEKQDKLERDRLVDTVREAYIK